MVHNQLVAICRLICTRHCVDAVLACWASGRSSPCKWPRRAPRQTQHNSHLQVAHPWPPQFLVCLLRKVEALGMAEVLLISLSTSGNSHIVVSASGGGACPVFVTLSVLRTAYHRIVTKKTTVKQISVSTISASHPPPSKNTPGATIAMPVAVSESPIVKPALGPSSLESIGVGRSGQSA